MGLNHKQYLSSFWHKGIQGKELAMGFKGLRASPRIVFSDGVRIARGKFKDMPIEKVASEHPTYLSWMRRAAKNGDIKLTDEEFYALADVMEKFHIPEK